MSDAQQPLLGNYAVDRPARDGQYGATSSAPGSQGMSRDIVDDRPQHKPTVDTSQRLVWCAEVSFSSAASAEAEAAEAPPLQRPPFYDR